MKNLILILILGCFTFIGCDNSTVQGPAGPQGESGNSNVKIYEFDGHNFSLGDTLVTVDNISADTLENSIWFVYFVNYGANGTSTYSYSVPGSGVGSASFYSYYNILISANNRVVFYLRKETGPGELYSKIRIVQFYIPNSEGRPLKELLPIINFRDYNEVVRYYHLEE